MTNGLMPKPTHLHGKDDVNSDSASEFLVFLFDCDFGFIISASGIQGSLFTDYSGDRDTEQKRAQNSQGLHTDR